MLNCPAKKKKIIESEKLFLCLIGLTHGLLRKIICVSDHYTAGYICWELLSLCISLSFHRPSPVDGHQWNKTKNSFHKTKSASLFTFPFVNCSCGGEVTDALHFTLYFCHCAAIAHFIVVFAKALDLIDFYSEIGIKTYIYLQNACRSICTSKVIFFVIVRWSWCRRSCHREHVWTR